MSKNVYSFKGLLRYYRAIRSAGPDVSCSWVQLFRQCRRWLEYLDSDGDFLLLKETPWITFAAIDFLCRHVGAESTVFEYGSGASTVFWARRAKSVVSVEHDPEWYEKMLAELGARGISNVELKLIEPEPDPEFAQYDSCQPGDFISGNPYYDGNNFRSYAKSIEHYPDGYFSVVTVDGRARPSCVIQGAVHVRPGGLLLLDNSDRPRYAKAMSMLDSSFSRIDLPGPSPLVDFFTRTTVWRRGNLATWAE